MVLSRTSTYALRILIQLSREEDKIVSAQSLHDLLGIKKQYLRRLLTNLAGYGFIKSSLGCNGGYMFARRPEDIFIYEVIEAIEGPDVFEGCLLGVVNCKQSPQCALHSIWTETREKMLNTLRETTVATLKPTEYSAT